MPRFKNKQAFSGRQAKEALRGLTTLMRNDERRRAHNGRLVRRNAKEILRMSLSRPRQRLRRDVVILQQASRLLGR